VTASHGTFVFDKPAGSESAEVIMPDGRKERPNFVVRGKRRSIKFRSIKFQPITLSIKRVVETQ